MYQDQIVIIRIEINKSCQGLNTNIGILICLVSPKVTASFDKTRSLFTYVSLVLVYGFYL